MSRIVVVSVAVLWAALGAITLWSVIAQGRPSRLWLVLVFGAASVGLFRRAAWARVFSVAGLWLLLLLGLFGFLFNPYRLMDRGILRFDQNPWILAVVALSWTGIILLALHVLGKHKGDFH